MEDFAIDNKHGQHAIAHMLNNMRSLARGSTYVPFPGVNPPFFNIKPETADEEDDSYDASKPEYTQSDFALEALPALEAVGILGGNFNGTVPTFLNRLFGVQLDIQKKIFACV